MAVHSIIKLLTIINGSAFYNKIANIINISAFNDKIANHNYWQ